MELEEKHYTVLLNFDSFMTVLRLQHEHNCAYGCPTTAVRLLTIVLKQLWDSFTTVLWLLYCVTTTLLLNFDSIMTVLRLQHNCADGCPTTTVRLLMNVLQLLYDSSTIILRPLTTTVRLFGCVTTVLRLQHDGWGTAKGWPWYDYNTIALW